MVSTAGPTWGTRASREMISSSQTLKSSHSALVLVNYKVNIGVSLNFPVIQIRRLHTHWLSSPSFYFLHNTLSLE